MQLIQCNSQRQRTGSRKWNNSKAYLGSNVIHAKTLNVVQGNIQFTAEECGEISRAVLKGELSMKKVEPTVRDGGVQR